MTIDNVLQQLAANRSDAIERMKAFLRIPSISTQPNHAQDCHAAAEWVKGQLEAAGFNADIHATDGHPIVVARNEDAPDDAPKVLFYGHYDVQPPDPLNLWTTEPFEPTIRDNRLYARGASDDKGQVCCFLEAIRAWHESVGRVPVNITVLIEGEEECGSENLDKFINEHQDLLAADVALISDTAMWGEGTPAICYALRGMVYFDVKLHGPDRDLHSGVYGGSLANPATELVHVLGKLFDDQHRVTIDGFYDDVIPLEQDERDRWKNLDFDDDEFAKSVGLDALHGEAGFTTLERRWARPSLDINGIYGGYMDEGAKTVIPSFAGAKVSMRLAANQDPVKIDTAFRAWLERQTPPGCRWEITDYGKAYPVILPTDSRYMQAARRAIEIGCNKSPVLMREGATIPVASTFKTVLGIDTLLMGFGRNDDCIHSPNEKFDLDCYDMGCRSHVALIWELAG